MQTNPPNAMSVASAALGFCPCALLVSALLTLGCAHSASPAAPSTTMLPGPPSPSPAEPANEPANEPASEPGTMPATPPAPERAPAAPAARSEDCSKCKDCTGSATFTHDDGSINTCCRWVPDECPDHMDDGMEAYCTRAEECPRHCCEHGW